MKNKLCIKQILLLFIVISFITCSWQLEKQSKDEFFKPLTTMPRKKYVPKTVVYDSVRNELVKAIIFQNKEINRLDSILNALDNTNKVKSIFSHSDYEAINMTGRISDSTLILLVNNNNLTLKRIVGNLRALINSWQTERSYMKTVIERLEQKVNYMENVCSGIDSTYYYGMSLYKRRNYGKAIEVFKQILNDSIGYELHDDCRFWIGVCYFNLNDIKSAILEFKKVLDIPDADRRESALFMLGQCYEKIGQTQNAKRIFDKLLIEYPEGDFKQVTKTKIALLR